MNDISKQTYEFMNVDKTELVINLDDETITTKFETRIADSFIQLRIPLMMFSAEHTRENIEKYHMPPELAKTLVGEADITYERRSFLPSMGDFSARIHDNELSVDAIRRVMSKMAIVIAEEIRKAQAEKKRNSTG